MFRTTRRSLLALALVAPSFACGDLGDDQSKPPLVVIEGQLQQQASVAVEPPSSAAVRVALVWQTGSSGFKTSVDVETIAEFPSKFRLALNDPPPAVAMTSGASSEAATPTENPLIGDDVVVPPQPRVQPKNVGDGSGTSWAIGTIVAYEDRNGNGQLDLVEADQPETDRVLGANKNLLVVYVESAAGDGHDLATFFDASAEPARGYNLLQRTPCEARKKATGTDDPPPAPCRKFSGEWLPLTTLYALPLSAAPELAEMMCRSSEGSTTIARPTDQTPVPVDDLPPIESGQRPTKDQVRCAPDGRSFTYVECTTTSQGLCKANESRCRTLNVFMKTAEPRADWLCTVQ
jgi:hypothetical protein